MHSGRPGHAEPEAPESSLSPLKRAFLAIEDLQARLAVSEQRPHEPIAVIGIGCRLPGGVSSPDDFWRLLRAGTDAVTTVPADRWDADALYDPDPDAPGKMSTRWGGFLQNVDQFDAQFFGIAPREAASMDPQQRLLLEVCWESLEHAGLAPDRLAGSKTGVFVGLTSVDYARLHLQSQGTLGLNAYYASGTAASIVSGRVSYVLGLQGPSMTVDTACSSSLVSVHLACQSLRNGDSTLALAGGVNLVLTPENGITFTKYRMMAADGRCKAFDASADGFVRAEGCGIVVLKRLSDAMRDGDRVLAVIRGTAVNQDGASSGLTAPNGPSQEAVIRQALADGGVAPHEVGYVEAHGTGTSLGDPIEVRAIGAVLATGRPTDAPLLVGSVKTNLGHLEAAAGITGLIKSILVVQHGEVPPNLHFSRPSPHIDWDDLSVVVPTQLRPWPTSQTRRIAGVSSFGFSGTNAHMVVEAAPAEQARVEPERPRHVLTLSARTDTALRELVGRTAAALDATPGISLVDLCHTANAGRADFAHRVAVTGSEAVEIRESLERFLVGAQQPNVLAGLVESADPPKIAFLFSGQGSQYAGMGWQLYQTQSVFRAALDRCVSVLDGMLDRPFLRLIDPNHEDHRLLDQTAYAQPTLFALEYALAEVWRSWGVRPSAVLGHSLGELVAACYAGVFTLEDALKLVVARGRLMQDLPTAGTMASIFAPEARVSDLIQGFTDRVSIAALNGPEHVVVAGERDAIHQIVRDAETAGLRCRHLHTSQAFHSPLLDPMLGEFERRVAALNLKPPSVRLISNVTGRAASDDVTRPAYWRMHARQPVRFAESIAALLRDGYQTFIEIGPHPVLVGMGHTVALDQDVTWVPSLRRGRDDWQQLTESVGRLYTVGARIDWEGFDRGFGGRVITLPTYPFQRQRHWLPDAAPLAQPARAMLPGAHPLLGQPLRSALSTRQFERELTLADLPYLRDHLVGGVAILPGTGFIELARAAAQEHFGPGSHAVCDLVIQQRLACAEGETRVVQTVVEPEADGRASLRIFSQSEQEPEWVLHALATLERAGAASSASGSTPRTPTEIRATLPSSLDPTEHYARLRDRQLVLGPSLQGVQELWFRDGQGLGRLRLPDEAGSPEPYGIHPALLDAALQVIAVTVGDRAGTYLPLGLQTFRLLRRPSGEVWCHVTLRATAPQSDHRPADTLLADLCVLEEDGTVVAKIEGLQLRRARPETLTRDDVPLADALYTVTWRPAGRQLAPPTDQAPAAETSADHLASLVHAQAKPERERQRLDHYSNVLPQLELASFGYIADAFRTLGWQKRVGERGTTESLRQELGVVSHYAGLLNRFVDVLQEAGIVVRSGSTWTVVAELPHGTPDRICQDLMAERPEVAGQATLTMRCGQHLADALRGVADPVQLLFPDGSLALAESLYLENPQAIAYNRLISTAVVSYLESVPAYRTLRILEIGAGTGGTTAQILPHLPAGRTEYVFTDVSPHFLSRAREKFAAYPFVRYELFDLERDPVDQGLALGSFDVVIAANSVHATSDLRGSLRRIERLLAPGGLLAMLELTERQRWIDISFGLTEGWWRFTDRDLRADYPLLERDEWTTLLTEVGFSWSAALPEATEAGPFDRVSGPSQQAILLAHKPVTSAPLAANVGLAGSWLILADHGGIGEGVAAVLRQRGQNAAIVLPGNAYDRRSAQEFRADPGSTSDLRRVIENVTGSGGGPLRGVLHLWSLNVAADDRTNADGVVASQLLSVGSALHLTQALTTAGLSEMPRLWIVTRGSQAVTEGCVVEPGQASAWGFGWNVSLEHPELSPVRADLDPQPGQDTVAVILDEIDAPDGEDQVAWRGSTRHVARLTRHQLAARATHAEASTEGATSLQLGFDARGSLDNLRLAPARRQAPGPGEVEIQVHATGLNFKDVLNVLGMYPGDPGALGNECAGTVTRVGDGVAGLQVGDAVLALAPGSFATYATAPASFVLPKPERLSFEEAAGFPIAFITADYCLNYLGRMKPGERVLIHAAAGGVGLAAVKLAQRASVEVFATAGSPAKRDYLRSLGIKHVFDSRALDFAREILEATGGEGVDLVLNSLAGESIARSISVLRHGGRFLEIGKSDHLTAQQIADLGHGRAYFVIDWGEAAREQPTLIRSMFQSLLAAVEAGDLGALPTQTFGRDDAADAFRYMAQARQIGKIVLTQPVPGLQRDTTVRADATYFITGGLRGLGLEVTRLLVANGAQRIALMGRQAPSVQAQAVIDELRASGTEVMVFQGDVSREDDVRRALEASRSISHPLRGIVHSAGVLDDGVLAQQTWERFRTVLGAKDVGSWLLHTHTLGDPLDFFVLFSSAASMLGSTGQSNHVAANAYLDALAHHRRARGLPAVSINWGGWSEIGAAAGTAVSQRLTERGVAAIRPADGLALLERLLAEAPAQIGVFPIAWEQFLQRYQGRSTAPYFSELVTEQAAVPVPTPRTTLLVQQLADAPENRRPSLVVDYVKEQSARILGLSVEQVGDRVPLHEMGLDSLMAVELRNVLRQGIGGEHSLPATLVFDFPTVEALAHYLVGELGIAADEAADAVVIAPNELDGFATDTGIEALLSALDDLSDDEIARLGAQRMGYVI